MTALLVSSPPKRVGGESPMSAFELWTEGHARFRQGHGNRQMARALGLDRKTITRILAQERPVGGLEPDGARVGDGRGQPAESWDHLSHAGRGGRCSTPALPPGAATRCPPGQSAADGGPRWPGHGRDRPLLGARGCCGAERGGAGGAGETVPSSHQGTLIATHPRAHGHHPRCVELAHSARLRRPVPPAGAPPSSEPGRPTSWPGALPEVAVREVAV
jgi:hypothetical protein